jgi:hypothetical protein
MHWHATERRDHEALRRLAVVLLTLAAIAEGVSRRSAAVRAIVLWLLCRAESRASAFAWKIGAAGAIAFPSTGSPVCRVGGSGEAARLADRFRALAAAFFAILCQIAQRFRTTLRRDPLSLSANSRELIGAGRRASVRHRSFTDTS